MQAIHYLYQLLDEDYRPEFISGSVSRLISQRADDYLRARIGKAIMHYYNKPVWLLQTA